MPWAAHGGCHIHKCFDLCIMSLSVHDTPPSEWLCLQRVRKAGVISAIICSQIEIFSLLSRPYCSRNSHCCRARDYTHRSAPRCCGKGAFIGAPLIDNDAGWPWCRAGAGLIGAGRGWGVGWTGRGRVAAGGGTGRSARSWVQRWGLLLLHSHHHLHQLIVNLSCFCHSLILHLVGPWPWSVLFKMQLFQVGLVSCNVLKGWIGSKLREARDGPLSGCHIAWICRWHHCRHMSRERTHWTWIGWHCWNVKVPQVARHIVSWNRKVSRVCPFSIFWNTGASCWLLSRTRSWTRTPWRWSMRCNCCCTQGCCHFRSSFLLSRIWCLHWNWRLFCWWR